MEVDNILLIDRAHTCRIVDLHLGDQIHNFIDRRCFVCLIDIDVT